MTRKFTLLFAALLLASSFERAPAPAALHAAEASAATRQPNIVLLVADDLGYNDLGCYGASLVKTPRIDALASQGVRFSDAHSMHAICTPSRYSILSGTCYFHAKFRGKYPLMFHEGQVTLPALLKSGGYRTAALGKWHNGFGRESEPDYNRELKPGPLEIGFDSFFGTPRTHSEPPLVFVQDHWVVGLDPADPISVDPSKQFGAHGRQIGGAKAAAARPDDQIDFILADKAARYFTVQKPGQPFFLYLALAAVHNPINPAPEFRDKSAAGLYGDYAQQIDHCTGLVLDALEKNGLAQDTLVIFTSDNGGRYENTAMKAGHRTNGQLLGQKTDAWEGGHRVPCIARWPSHIPAGTVRKEFFAQVDLLATLAEAAGIPLPPGASPDGSSELAAFLQPTDAPAKRTEAVLQGTKGMILRQGDWIYIPKQGSLGYTAPEPERPFGLPWARMGFVNSDIDDRGQIKPDAPQEQLYNLATDLRQAKNLAAEQPDRLRAMRARLAELVGPVGGRRAEKSTPVESVLALAGSWRFRLDPDNLGVEQKWFAENLDDAVTLPGTTDTNQKGVFKDEQAVDRLSRVWYWKGPVWYQRDVVIPDAWKGKRIALLLERTKTTRVWVDDQDCGAEDTLSAPQLFDVTRSMTPGEHTLTVLVDNARLPPVGPAHAVDERTQTNWNGIVGRIEIRATDPVWLEEVQVYPDAAKKQARVRAVVGNLTGQPAAGQLTADCQSYNVAAPEKFPTQSVAVQAPGRRSIVEFIYQPGEAVPLWDEFQPAMLRLGLKLATSVGGQSCTDQQEISFGLRDFQRAGTRLAINGRTVFLRGRTDSANYPLTGYPPMDKDGWRRVLAIIKAWGLNHVRFHSWCPPEAAFAAADELGVYFQVEFPNKRSAFQAPENQEAAQWNIDYLDVPASGTNGSLFDYARREGELIFRHFGNHPSFVMFTLGNELGRTPAMFELVARFRQRDPRHLYAQGSNNMHWAPSFANGDDFWVTCKTGKDLPLRGAFFAADFPYGHIDYRPPSTLVDYSQSIRDVPAPIVGHEIAEFEVTPDFREIPRYTGVLKARNLEIFRERLKDANMLDLSHDFLRASGALAAICQREDLEAALRTPGFSGFHWLDLQDFPGQGTALVGMLNVFLESKGIIAPEKWRQFCSETVPLFLMEKYTWTTAETFAGEIKVAHYGAADIPNARVTWAIGDSAGRAIASGTLGPLTIKQGEVFPVGRIRAPLDQVKAPQQLLLTLAIEGTVYRNSYDLWVYPPKVDTTLPADVIVTDRLDAAARAHLRRGGKVLLFPRHDELQHCVQGAFTTDFWCWPMFAKAAVQRKLEPAPGTQGFLCDPAHPALAQFPTEFHSNWQWWWLVKNSRPIILDETPADYRPIIHVIDNFARNHKLGLLFETRVGPGQLLVCASDLPALQDRPEARQLYHSLLRYAASNAFAPQAALDGELLEKLLPGDAP